MTFGTVRQRTRAGNGTKVLPAGTHRGAYRYDIVESGDVGCGTVASVSQATRPASAPVRLEPPLIQRERFPLSGTQFAFHPAEMPPAGSWLAFQPAIPAAWNGS